MRASRRSFLKLAGAGAAAVVHSACAESHAAPPAKAPPPNANAQAKTGAIPKRALGKTGAEVSILGLGGAHLGAVKSDDEATKIVHAAIDAGVTFFDNAWEYHDGKSETRVGKALEGKRKGVFVMTKVCTHGRDGKVAMEQLEESLKRLKTDWLDLWQVHECVYDDDPERHYAKDGVLEAMAKAKQQGKVRFVGFTGHKDPAIHLDMITRGFPFDTCQMPLNCFDASFRSFQKRVVPEAQKRGIGVLGMKSLTGRGDPVRKGVVTAEEALRYAMSLPVSVVISGVDAMEILEQNLAVARGFTPMSEAERAALEKRVADEAGDGHLELYKTTLRYDGKTGREQHGFPSEEEVPL